MFKRSMWGASMSFRWNCVSWVMTLPAVTLAPKTCATVAAAGGHGMMWGPAVARVAADLAIEMGMPIDARPVAMHPGVLEAGPVRLEVPAVPRLPISPESARHARPGLANDELADRAAQLFQRHLLFELGYHRLQLEIYGFNERAQHHAERAGIRDRRGQRGNGGHGGLNDRLFNPEQLAYRRGHRLHFFVARSSYDVGADPADRRSQPWNFE